MRFLIIIPFLNSRIGGMERFLIEFSTGLLKAGHEVTILAGRHGEDIGIDGVRIIRHRLFVPPFLKKLAKYVQISLIARNHLKKERYDAVIAMGHSGIFIRDFIWRASGSPIPLVRKQRLAIRRNLFSSLAIRLDLYTQELMEKTCIRKACCHMFPSLYLKSFFEEHYAFKSKKYFIPCSGTPSARDSAGGAAADWTSMRDRIKILAVGGLSAPTKGRDAIIKAFRKVDLSDKILVAAGGIDVELEEPLKGHTVSLGTVDFRKMPDLYRNCDLLIFPSLFEGFPNVILEALTYGLPVIASRLEGIEEYFLDGVEIIIVEKNDPEGLAEKINLLAGSKDIRCKLSVNAKKRAEQFSYDNIVKEFTGFVASKETTEKNLLKRK